MSDDKDYSTMLPVGEHLVELEASDGPAQSSIPQAVTVEQGQIYPAKPLHLKYKGVSYSTGTLTPEWCCIPPPTKELMDDQLDTIRNDLGRNAVIVDAGGDFEDELIECARLAIEKGFNLGTRSTKIHLTCTCYCI